MNLKSETYLNIALFFFQQYKNISQKIRAFYYAASSGEINNTTLLEYSKMVSDVAFNYGINRAAQLHTNYTSGRIYFYK